MDENKSGVVTLLFRNSTMLSDNQFLQAMVRENTEWVFDPYAIRQRIRMLLEPKALDNIQLE